MENDWNPVNYNPLVATVSVKLRLIQLFPSDAKDWKKTSQYENQRNNKLTNNQIAQMLSNIQRREINTNTDKDNENNNGNIPDSGIGENSVSRFWSNVYGISNVDMVSNNLAKLAERLVEETFDAIISPSMSAATQEIAQLVIDHKGDKSSLILQFKKRYEAIIELIRNSIENNVDALALVAHYDEWLTYLMYLSRGDIDKDGYLNIKNKNRIVEKFPLDPFHIVIQRNFNSTRKLSEKLENVSSSPLADLYRFHRLTNELQSRCAAVSDTKDNQIDIIENISEKYNYFEKLDRFLEITAERRIDEPMHGIIIANTIGGKKREERVIKYGRSMIRAMAFCLRIAKGDSKYKAPVTHPVLQLRAPLFIGDQAPRELDYLMTYFRDGFHDKVLETYEERARRL